MKCLDRLSKSILRINFGWLPIKIHYFLMFGSIAGVVPFLTVLGKDLGLNATAVGITYTIYPLSIFLCKPLFGLLADFMQNIKTLIIFLIVSNVVSLLCILLINPINKDSCLKTFQCIDGTESTNILRFDIIEECAKNFTFINETISCNVSFQNSSAFKRTQSYIRQVDVDKEFPHDSERYLESYNHLINSSNLKCFIIFKEKLSEIRNKSKETDSLHQSTITCDHEFEKGLASEESIEFYYTYQFWVYLLLIVTSSLTITTAMSLSDVSCIQLLGDKKDHYGRQRLWGTVSSGIITLLSGYFNDLISNKDGHIEYLAGFYIMIILSVLNMIVLLNMKLPKVQKDSISPTLVADVIKLLKANEFIAFASAVFVIGSLNSLVFNYLFWYLTDLGANQTLLGLASAIKCLLAEVPFFFFSGWFIRYLGYFNCLTCSFAAFALRLGLYSLLKDPWMVLPIELLQGFTFAVFYASNTGFASGFASPGTEATVLGLLAGIYEGLGYAFGSFLGGLGFTKLGGSQTYLIAACISIICVPLNIVSHVVNKKAVYKSVSTREPADENKC